MSSGARRRRSTRSGLQRRPRPWVSWFGEVRRNQLLESHSHLPRRPSSPRHLVHVDTLSQEPLVGARTCRHHARGTFSHDAPSPIGGPTLSVAPPFMLALCGGVLGSVGVPR